MREEVKDWNANFEKAATILESLWNHCDSDDQRLNTVIEQYENLRKKAQISFQVFGEVAQDSAGSFDEMLQAKLKKVEEKAAVTLAEPLSFRQTSTNSDDLIAERVLFSKKDPFTMKDITQPVRNIICKHVYDEEALQHFLSTAKGHIYCPQKSCVNKKPLSMDNVTRYPDFFNFVIN